MSTLRIPELALVALVGTSGSGKSTFARKHFLPTEVLSSDYFRGLISDNENEQAVSRDAFEALNFIAAKRLKLGRLTVIDATNVQPEARRQVLDLAREFDVLPVAIVLDLPERVCHERNRERPDRQFGPHVVRRQRDDLRRSLRGLEREGFRYVYVLSSPEEVDAVTIERQPLWTNRRWEHGPFDLIGDVHGCCDELEALLGKLGYQPDADATWRHPEGRKAVFLGDLVDRGPRVLDTLNLARRMVAAEMALCVPGNHDVKLHRWLRGRKVQVTHGLEQSIREIEALPETEAGDYRKELDRFLDSLVSHYVLDDGKLVVAHAGMKAEYQGRSSRRVRDFALFGESTGETDEFGLPIRYPWAQDYRGSAMVVYGHTPVPEAEWLNRTINLDTGCVFGGRLTALRYPELELVSVPAAREYAAPIRPLRPETAGVRSAQQEHDDLLDLEDVSGKRIVNTRLRPNITIREENTIAALEVMSRFAANPKWLIYLPPTMSPSETSREPGLLEHPAEALAYFQSEGVERVVCEEKHMGSRAVVVVCRDEETARRRFGVDEAETGIVYTRTGRRFFDDLRLEAELLDRVRSALEHSGLWDELETDWICLDCELMPWSAKAQALLTQQYAPVGAAATAGLDAALQLLEQAKARGGDVEALLTRHHERRSMAERYVASYRRYCWDVHSLADLRLAPFHILATEGKVPFDRNHVWHMETLRRMCEADPALLLATPYREVDLTDEASRAEAVNWWKELTGRGGEGMVVKPLDFVVQGKRGLVQPALKCRGAEYLRIIYGPEYTLPENLERLRQRGLGAKRSLAQREFALGLEGLERFVQREPLRRVHECVFSVLALESEPVDPRL